MESNIRNQRRGEGHHDIVPDLEHRRSATGARISPPRDVVGWSFRCMQLCVDSSVDVAVGAGVRVGGALDRPSHLNYSTTRSPWSVLFSRRPPSAVTVTMSSIRTPNLPAR